VNRGNKGSGRFLRGLQNSLSAFRESDKPDCANLLSLQTEVSSRHVMKQNANSVDDFGTNNDKRY
jgi:hypothetical protein